MLHLGGCYCGGISLEFTSDVAPADTVVHACQCTFCRKHGARTIADPDGRLVIKVTGEAPLGRYTFGFETADFLICRTCGVYVAAITRDTGRPTGIVAVNALDDRALFDSAPVPTNHDNESKADRIMRRARAWTPARIETGDQRR